MEQRQFYELHVMISAPVRLLLYGNFFAALTHKSIHPSVGPLLFCIIMPVVTHIIFIRARVSTECACGPRI